MKRSRVEYSLIIRKDEDLVKALKGWLTSKSNLFSILLTWIHCNTLGISPSGSCRVLVVVRRLWRGSQIDQKCKEYSKWNHSWNGWVCVFESSTPDPNHVGVIDRACSCLIVARLIKLTLTRLEMLLSRMAHHLTFQISCCCYGRKQDRKCWDVIVYRDKIVRKSTQTAVDKSCAE